MKSAEAYSIFEQSVKDYHILDRIDQPHNNPYPANSVEHLMYRKNWIDSIQWHYEDLIRDPNINPVEELDLKRKIDASNQDRTDTVENIDSYLLEHFSSVTPQANATSNTESPAWTYDRLSILSLKIYHMREQSQRNSATAVHRQQCADKLAVLQTQREDLSLAIDQLLDDLSVGRKTMKVYKQMKMYNDEALNPVLYSSKTD
ncbi:MAG: DUF4254 domain-containing protein [Flavobacteriaceae bacterium]